MGGGGRKNTSSRTTSDHRAHHGSPSSTGDLLKVQTSDSSSLSLPVAAGLSKSLTPGKRRIDVEFHVSGTAGSALALRSVSHGYVLVKI